MRKEIPEEVAKTFAKQREQVSLDQLIKMVGVATTELTVMQGAMAELMNILIQQNDTNREREDG